MRSHLDDDAIPSDYLVFVRDAKIKGLWHLQLSISKTHKITQDAITGVDLFSNSGSRR